MAEFKALAIPVYDKQLDKILRGTVAADAIEVHPIVACRAADTLPVALNALIKNKVLSLPVLDDKGSLAGFIDWLDILHFLVSQDAEVTRKGYDEFMRQEAFTFKKVSEVANLSGQDGMLKVMADATMWTVLNAMMDFGELHRVPIVNRGGEVKGLLSQSDVIAWIQPFLDEFEFGLFTVRDFQLGYKADVQRVGFQETAKDAFKKMKEKKVSALAVVNSQDRLYGNLSATDLKVLGADSKFFSHLSKTVEEYLKLIPPNPVFGLNPIFVKPADTLRMVARKFVDAKVHRLYVVQEGFEIVGVISLSDVIRQLLSCATAQDVPSPPTEKRASPQAALKNEYSH